MAMSAGTIDEALVARAAAGEEAAFARIVAAHQHDLNRVTYLICGDLDLADEAVQRTWVVAWKKLAAVRDPGRLRSWLVAVASNEARQVVRTRGRRAVREVDVADHEPTGSGDPAGRSDDLDLANALRRLSVDDRQLLAMRFVAGYDSFEIGRMTGRSASGIRARLGRLIVRLRRELEDA
jgi:RNA polymerase sigma-70 factor (ECF subfamily)